MLRERERERERGQARPTRRCWVNLGLASNLGCHCVCTALPSVSMFAGRADNHRAIISTDSGLCIYPLVSFLAMLDTPSRVVNQLPLGSSKQAVSAHWDPSHAVVCLEPETVAVKVNSRASGEKPVTLSLVGARAKLFVDTVE